jgi:hypothetical protein
MGVTMREPFLWTFFWVLGAMAITLFLGQVYIFPFVVLGVVFVGLVVGCIKRQSGKRP